MGCRQYANFRRTCETTLVAVWSWVLPLRARAMVFDDLGKSQTVDKPCASSSMGLRAMRPRAPVGKMPRDARRSSSTY